MELKRRQQAHHERECKEKEKAAMAARLLEYAKHADEDEEELFGNATAPTDKTDAVADTQNNSNNPAAAAAEGTESAGSTIASDGVPHATDEPASPDGRENSVSAATSAAATESAAVETHTVEERVTTNDGMKANTDPVSEEAENALVPPTADSIEKLDGSEDEDSASSTLSDVGVVDGDEPAARSNQPQEEVEAKYRGNKTVDDAAETGSAGDMGEPATLVPQSSKEATKLGGGQGMVKNGAVKNAAAGSSPMLLPSHSTEGTDSPASDPAPATARPPVKRTYGRKTRDAHGNVVAKHADVVVAAAVAPNSGGERGGLSADSQALWLEQPDSAPPPEWDGEESAGYNCMGGSDNFVSVRGSGDDESEDTCGMTLGLSNDDDDEEIRQASGSIVSATAADQVQLAVPRGGSSSQTGADIDAEERPRESCADDNEGIEGDVVRRTESSKPNLTVEEEGETTPAVTADVARGNDVELKSLNKEEPLNTAASAVAAPPYTKMKITADGTLAAAPVQRAIRAFFNKGRADVATTAAGPPSSTTPSLDSTVPAPLAKKTKVIAPFFGPSKVQPSTNTEGSSASSAAASDKVGQEIAPAGGAIGVKAAAIEGNNVDEGEYKEREGNGPAGGTDGIHGEERTKAEGNPEEDEQDKQAEEGEEQGADEPEEPKEPKDRSAKFRAMLEAERLEVRRNKKLRKSGMMDDEAEEEEEEEAVRGLGDFGFGVRAGGNGTSATGTGAGKGDEEEEEDDEIREEVRFASPLSKS